MEHPPMIKNLTRNLFQKLLGFHRYLFVFSHINILRIRWGLSEKAFKHFINLIDDDGVILDIGANIGCMTVMLAKARPAAAVYAFEPIPANRMTLEKVVGSYGLKNVHIFANALGDVDQMVEMIMPFNGTAKMQGLSHVVEPGQNEAGDTFTVRMMPLDQMPELVSLPRISAIKIDVENFEYFVLKGGKLLLNKHRPIVFCELWNNHRREDCFRLMQQLGYRIQWYDNGRLTGFSGEEVLDFFFMP